MQFMDDLLGAAAELGLTVRGSEAHGTLDGSRVSLSFDLLGGNGATAVAHGWVDPPLDLGLEMHRRVAVGLGQPDPVSGDADLDSEFVIEGDEPARLRDFFDPPLCARLVATHRASMECRLRDAGCAIFGLYGLFDVDVGWAGRALGVAAETARRMREARDHTPPAAPLAGHAAALRACAAARGLAFMSTPLQAWGEVEGRPVKVGAARTGRGRHHLHARAELEGDLAIGLEVRRQGILDGLRTLLGGQDVLVGDAPFDRRFLVHARPERADRVAALLDEATRATLLAVDGRAGAVALDDRGVTVDPIEVGHDPQDLSWLLDALVEVTGQISKNLVHGGDAAGPYR
jgi:hypothetical protein